MKFLNISVCVLLLSCLVFGQSAPSTSKSKVSYKNPNPQIWILSEEMGPTVDKTGKKTRGYFMFKRKPILDSLKNPIEPMFGIFYENDVIIPKDVVEYSVGYLGDKPYKIKRNLLGGYPKYSDDKNSVVFEGDYVREGVKHKILLGYVFDNGTGAEIIADSTESVFPKVKDDMFLFLKSVKLIEQ